MNDRLVRVLSTPDVFEGVIVRSRLEDEGIPVMTSGDDGPYRVGPVHVFVPAEFEVQARLVIDTVRSGAVAITDEQIDAMRSGGDTEGDAGDQAQAGEEAGREDRS